jgi:hypothetical protein
VNVTELDDVLPPVLIVDSFPSVAVLIEVTGGTVSMVQLNNAGEGSIVSTPSTDLILKI